VTEEHQYDPYSIEGSGIVGGLLGGGSCFAANTLVWTPTGLKPIEEMRVGDPIVAFRPDGKLVVSTVEATHIHEGYLVNRYTLWNAEFIATPNHHVLTANNAYKALQDFEITECLVDALGELQPLLQVNSEPEPTTVYNLTVATWHNYLITDKGIRVSNGGGSKSSGGKSENDAYKSNATAYIVELLSAGVVEGIVGGMQGIYFDRTPVQNTDGSLNFKNFQYDFRPGTQNQTFMPGYSDEISSEKSVDQEVKQQLPVARTVISSEIDGIRIRVALTQQKYEENGDVVGMTIQYKIFLKQGGGAFELRVNETKKGRFSSLTEFEYYLPVNNFNNTVDQYTVRVEKVNADIPEGDTKQQQTLKWQSYTEVIETKLNYAHSAVIGEQFNPKDFSSIPSRQYKLAGILIQIPTNATVNPTDRGLDFNSSTWDGTFYTPPLACADPAWIAYYLMTDPINGLGRYIDAPSIDKWSLYRCSLYNNQMVSNGLGGTERRFSCHTVLQQREDAWKVLEAVFSAFNCSHYWADGTVYFVQDRPLLPGEEYSWQFTQADVQGGQFVYSYSALRTRSSVAMVTWNDPSDFYNQTIEPVEDANALQKYGYKEIEFAAFGCISRGQAIRKGRYVLFSNNQETQTVSFSPRAFAAYVRPGDIIQIADAKRAAVRYGGLVMDATLTSIVIDSPVAILTSGYRLTCMMPDGRLNTRNVTNTLGTHSTLTVDRDFSDIPLPESNWVVSAPNVQPQLFRIISNSIDATDPTKHVITASLYIPDKYDYIENGWEIREQPIRQDIPTVVATPRSITLNSTTVSGSPTLIVSWRRPLTESGQIDPFIDSYQVEWSRDQVTWESSRIITNNNTTYQNVTPGVYYGRVQSIDITGRTSEFIYSRAFTVQVNQTPPVPITTETQDFTNPGNSSNVFFY
jgi:predicted phage tail protein